MNQLNFTTIIIRLLNQESEFGIFVFKEHKIGELCDTFVGIVNFSASIYNELKYSNNHINMT